MKENALFILLLLLIGWNTVSAQVPTTDIVTMKDGKVLTGRIIQYSPGSILRLEQMDGSLVELQDDEIDKIQQGVELPKKKNSSQNETAVLRELPAAKTHGFYANSMLSFAGGNSDNSGLALGAGFSQTFGYQLSQFLGIGGGIGIDNYSRRGETVYPIFGEVRSFLPSKKASGNFYALAAGGYALAFARKQLDITDADGGVMTHFALGYRATTTEGIDINVDIGPKFQTAHFERKLFNGDVEFRDVNYKRIVIRVGVGLW